MSFWSGNSEATRWRTCSEEKTQDFPRARQRTRAREPEHEDAVEAKQPAAVSPADGGVAAAPLRLGFPGCAPCGSQWHRTPSLHSPLRTSSHCRGAACHASGRPPRCASAARGPAACVEEPCYSDARNSAGSAAARLFFIFFGGAYTGAWSLSCANLLRPGWRRAYRTGQARHGIPTGRQAAVQQQHRISLSLSDDHVPPED